MEKDEELVRLIRSRVLQELEYQKDISDEGIREIIRNQINKYSKDTFLPLRKKQELGEMIFHYLRKLDILQPLIDDPDITEIMVNGPDDIFVEEMGACERWTNALNQKKS